MTVGLAAGLLVAVALAFAWSIGAHYTGACMGMAHAAGAIARRPALLSMALLTALGAALASGRVVATVGLSLVANSALTVADATAIVAGAFALTTVYNYARVPTSTIQILVFSLVGVALGAGIAVHWATLAGFAVLWVTAPLLALGLGFAYTRALLGRRSEARGAPPPTTRWDRPAQVLVVTALLAAFAMGANDVANATAVFVATRLTGVLLAGVIGGIALALGVVTWGGPMLTTVAFEIVRLDRRMAAAAQFAQATVVLGAVVLLGAFTSMNQALVGGMAGAGLARGRSTVHWPVVRGILLGWAVGPVSGLAVGWTLARLLSVA
jgi:PiT family inorganic phosphate transporter